VNLMKDDKYYLWLVEQGYASDVAKHFAMKRKSGMRRKFSLYGSQRFLE